MNRLLMTFVAFTSLVALAACVSEHGKKHGGPTQIIYSPTGDPLNGGPLGRPTCPEAMKHWFARVDTKHDDAVTLDEFLADARTQFQRMDIDKNGYLVSEEVERFRLNYRDESAGEKSGKKSAAAADDKEVGHAVGGSVIDPVMSADANLDYKVTPEEFTAYSQTVFRSLDTAHNGKLSLTEVTTVMCGAESHEKH